MKTAKKKRYIALAHIDEPELTYREVEVPEIVPLFINFDEARHVGSARLRRKGDRVYAIMEMNFNASEFGKMPAVVLGVDGAERLIEDGICYLHGGVVSAASIVSNEIWQEVYGTEVEAVSELD